MRLFTVRQHLRVLNGAWLDKVVHDQQQLTAGKTGLYEVWLKSLVENHQLLEWVLHEVARQPHRLPQLVRSLLLLGIWQLREGRTPAARVIDESVHTCRRAGFPGLAGTVNGILRNLERRMPQPEAGQFDDSLHWLSIRHSWPVWILEQLQQDYPDTELTEILTGFEKSRGIWFRLNTAASKPVLQQLRDDGLTLSQSDDNPLYWQVREGKSQRLARLAQQGKVIMHDISAARAVDRLQVESGMRVLDCCSAPGGKLLQMLNQYDGNVRYTVLEKASGRMQQLQQRLGSRQNLIWESNDLRNFSGGPFDRILLDVPCSGSGNFARKPDSRLHRKPEDLLTLLPLQGQLLRHAFNLLKPGGKLVYSTCSVFADENEKQVRRFLQGEPACYLDFDHDESLYLPWVHGHAGGYHALLTRRNS